MNNFYNCEYVMLCIDLSMVVAIEIFYRRDYGKSYIKFILKNKEAIETPFFESKVECEKEYNLIIEKIKKKPQE